MRTPPPPPFHHLLLLLLLTNTTSHQVKYIGNKSQRIRTRTRTQVTRHPMLPTRDPPLSSCPTCEKWSPKHTHSSSTSSSSTIAATSADSDWGGVKVGVRFLYDGQGLCLGFRVWGLGFRV